MRPSELDAPPESSVRPGRRSLEERRANPGRIFSAAETLFVEHGYEAVTMELVSRRAHVSKRTLYERFQSKSALFLPTAKRVGERKLDQLALVRVDA